jgi:hypothetical protein
MPGVKKLSNGYFGDMMLVERVFCNDLFNFFFRACIRDEDTAGARHFPAGNDERIIFRILFQVRNMALDVLVDLFQRGGVMDIDNEHGELVEWLRLSWIELIRLPNFQTTVRASYP